MKWVAIAALAAACAACDKSPFASDEPPQPPGDPSPPPRPSGPRSLAKMIDPDSGFEIDTPDPPAASGDLRADVAGFTSLDACVGQHANLDPVVSDAVRALGYDTLLRDACRQLQALKLKDASPCAGIAASGLQAHCEGLVAMETEKPDKCPWLASSDRALGRDPYCLAVATHDARVCAAVGTSQRLACEALATGDARRCLRGMGLDDRRACERTLERERSMFVPEEHDAHDATKPTGKATIHAKTGTAEPTQPDVDLARELEPGVVIAADPAGGTRLDVARDREAGLHLPSRGGAEHVRFAATVMLESIGPRVMLFEIDAPNAPPVVCPGAHCKIDVTMSKGDPRRGDAIALSFDGEFESTVGKYTMHAQIDSFVRDVVTRQSMFSAPR